MARWDVSRVGLADVEKAVEFIAQKKEKPLLGATVPCPRQVQNHSSQRASTELVFFLKRKRIRNLEGIIFSRRSLLPSLVLEWRDNEFHSSHVTRGEVKQNSRGYKKGI